MKINFAQIAVRMEFEGPSQTVDIRKPLGNHIHQTTGDLAMDQLARDIYFSQQPVELTQEQAKAVLEAAKQKFVCPVWQGLEKQMNETNNKEEDNQ